MWWIHHWITLNSNWSSACIHFKKRGDWAWEIPQGGRRKEKETKKKETLKETQKEK